MENSHAFSVRNKGADHLPWWMVLFWLLMVLTSRPHMGSRWVRFRVRSASGFNPVVCLALPICMHSRLSLIFVSFHRRSAVISCLLFRYNAVRDFSWFAICIPRISFGRWSKPTPLLCLIFPACSSFFVDLYDRDVCRSFHFCPAVH